MKHIIEDNFNEHIRVVKSIHNLTDEVAFSAQLCINCLKSGGKILLFGNGGSAADAQHIASELVGRYKVERESLPAISLTTDTSAITAISNDYGFNHLFERQLAALASKDDVAIGLSTSGNSLNVINALKMASKLKCNTIGLCGQSGGKMLEYCDNKFFRKWL